MRPLRHHLCARGGIGLVALMLAIAGCGPTYRQAQLVESVERICQQEHHLAVSARRVGQTFAVHLQHAGLLEQAQGSVRPAQDAVEVVGDVIETIHRVVFSSDATIRFYVIIASDPNIPGIAFMVVRYVDDVLRANVNLIPPTEFQSRTVFDLLYVDAKQRGLAQLFPTDIQLEEFLSWQLARRIQARLSDTLQAKHIPLADVGRCAGEFRNGEFAFTLSVEVRPDAPANQDVIATMFSEAASVVAQVLSSYRFEQFDAIRLIHPSTGRTISLPKTQLQLLK